MIRTLIVLALSAAWHMETERDPLGQSVYVAAVEPDDTRPEVGLKFSCGGVVGVVLQFNLGETEHTPDQFSTSEPSSENVHFEFPEGKYDSTAKRAPITDGLGTYEIKGSEAAFIAGLMKDSDQVSISRGGATYTFPLGGAALAIGEVVDACPFKYQQ